jgi:hypothetical protein
VATNAAKYLLAHQPETGASYGMKTTSRWSHLRRLFLLSGGLTLGTMLCASAFAGSAVSRESTSAQMQAAGQKPAQKKVVYYVISSASAIPRPITWIIGGVMTTAVPVDIIGRGETVTR